MIAAPPSRLAHPVIQRFFEISLYLLLVIGFTMLAATGKLDALSVLLCASALLGKGLVLLRRSQAVIAEEWTNYLTVIYIGFFALDYFLISETFIAALLHMVLFVAMVRMFSVQRERDYLYLGILAFAMVLGAAVLTVDWLFFAMFCVFVLLAVMTFVSMEMRRSWIASRADYPDHAREVGDLARLPASVSRACIALVVSIVLGTAVLFFLIPRKPSAGYLSNFASRSPLSTGFSEEVRLGEIGDIQQSSAVVMHVKFAPGVKPPQDLRWRGIALTLFDGHRWRGPHEDGPPESNARGMFLAMRSARLFTLRGRRVEYKVSLEPFGSRVFFVLPEAVLISGRYQTLQIDSTGSIFNMDSSRAVTDYSVLSEIPPPMPASLSPGAGTELGITANMYLDKPALLDSRVASLAEQITKDQPTAYLKAAAIERHLSTNFGYTLEQPSVPPQDPIANFLFERKQGHCEYFASAMVMMLRTIGIPSRVINGFRGGEYNDVTGSYIIRASNAHSWVEAYFPGYGWYTFDPTPSAAAAPASLSRIYLYLDAMREFWHDWVVNYDTGHQSTLGFAAVRQSYGAVERARGGIESWYNKWLRRVRTARENFQRHVNTWAKWTTAGCLLLIVLLVAPKLFVGMRRLWLSRQPGLEPHTAATIWYQRLLKLLARRGIRKLPTHTPREFLKTIGSGAVRSGVERFTVHYERARFGESVADAEKLPELYDELEEVSKG